MPRTPTGNMTELAAQIGERGRTSINSENRHLVRRWLTAAGVPSALVATMTMAELALVYNDTTDAELEKHAQPQLPQQPQAPAPAAPAPQQQDAAAQLAAVLARIMAGGGTIDPAQVRTIAQEEIAKAQLPRPVHVTVTTPTGTTTTTGHRHEQFETILKTMAAGANVYLIGPAGSGKTTLARHVAEALGRKFYYTGAVDSPYKLTGFMDAQGRYVRTAFREAFEHGGLWLCDEADASDPQALVDANAILASEPGQTGSWPDGMVKRHPDFVAIAAANTYGTGASREYVGRNQLDAATLDRFIPITMDYDEKLELAIAGNDDWTRQVQRWRKAKDKLKVRHIISPRASIMGAKLLAAGLSRSEVENMAVWKGLDSETVRKIKEAA